MPINLYSVLANILPRSNAFARNELAAARRLALSELSGVGQCQERLFVLSNAFARNELAAARRLALSELSGVGQCQERLFVLSNAFARNELAAAYSNRCMCIKIKSG